VNGAGSGFGEGNARWFVAQTARVLRVDRRSDAGVGHWPQPLEDAAP